MKKEKETNARVVRYELHITETARNNLKEDSYIFNEISERFKTMDELKGYLKERYGKIPHGTKMYIDRDNKSIEVGFIYSYWNKDISHNSKSWYQTDWVNAYRVESTPILIK